MNNKTLFTSYMAYLLAQHQAVRFGDNYDEAFANLYRKTHPNIKNDSVRREIKRMVTDLINIGAMSNTATIQRVVDEPELNHSLEWEARFYSPDNIIYEGVNTVTRGNINEPHVSVLYYTFTLKPYNEVPANLKKLYRIVKVINSEYSKDLEDQSTKVSKLVKEYASYFSDFNEMMEDIFDTVEYIKACINMEEEIFEYDDDEYPDYGLTKEERIQNITNLIVDMKLEGYGFIAKEENYPAYVRNPNRRRATQIPERDKHLK